METLGTKADADKPRLDLISSIATFEKARVYAFGAKKYEEHNWRKGLAWSRLIGATLRHLFSWMAGENNDPETGISHLAHAACNIDFLLEYAVTHRELDDRYTTSGGNPSYSIFKNREADLKREMITHKHEYDKNGVCRMCRDWRP